mmetsp:Transcript_17394/g.22611  ORF Transcript_17394/g.22611 Transcript_17394/m.22611 type:complete len:381 (-) Transcript_17394:286-1428(-)
MKTFVGIATTTSLCLSTLLSSNGSGTTHAFSVTVANSRSSSIVSRTTSTSLFSTSSSSTKEHKATSVEDAKTKLLLIARNLQNENGLFVVEKTAKLALEKAVKELEDAASLSTTDDAAWKPYGWPACVDILLGDWTLVCTTATNSKGVDTSKTPNFLRDPLQKIRSTILDVSNKYLVVQQKIKSTKGDNVIDRIDHTLELEPPKQLRDVLDNLPEQLSDVNINPLAVSKSKVVLVHKATVDRETAKTKMTLGSILLNVAGTSRVLDPAGKDIVGLNIPSLGEFMNTADFETTYIDENVRISRGKLGFVEQLRVFERTDPPTVKIDIESEFTEDEEIVDIESSIADVEKDSIATPPKEEAADDDEEEDSIPSDVEGEDISP